MNRSTLTLGIFVSVQIVNLSFLICDYMLIHNKIISITQVCIKYPVAGVTVILFQVLSPVSIALHIFWN